MNNRHTLGVENTNYMDHTELPLKAIESSLLWLRKQITRFATATVGQLFVAIFSLAILAAPVAAQTDGCDEQCQALRKAQDPLADVRAIMTDNTISFGTGKDSTAYSFQVQPVYSIPTSKGFNFIARGIVPIVGAPNGAGLPPLGTEPVSRSETTWGLSDTFLQGFFVPATEGGIKFGFGPQVSIRTRTNDALGGPGWGVGAAAVAFGFAGDLSYGAIIGQHWGQKGFNLTTIQPIAMYNLDLFGGSYVGYNNSITYDWDAGAGSKWQVPLGLTLGKTFLFESGHALDISLGGYGLAVRPNGGADWQMKLGISLLFP